MAGIHQTVGGLVVVAWIVVTILAAIEAGTGRRQLTRPTSIVAAALLLVQYVLGFGLLGSGLQNSAGHYIIALLILVPVAVQQSAEKRMSTQARGTAVLIASLAAAFLAVIAYLSGTWGASIPTP
jgi:phosphoglycerol transferase MdoB-like AlkP superfamily enzyme